MTPKQHAHLAAHLDQARLEGREVKPLTKDHPDLTLADAYAIERAGIDLRLSRGEKLVGMKMGLTSEAKRKQMGLDSPVYGTLTDAMRVPQGGIFHLTGKLHPKVEPELAFVTSRELKGPIRLEEAAEACVTTHPAMEILDSRYEGFKYFSLPDVVADNASSSHFAIADVGVRTGALALKELELSLVINGETKQHAKAEAISGHPLRSVVQLCELLATEGRSLPAGSWVMAGAATLAEPLHPGDHVEVVVGMLGKIEITVEP